MKKPVVEVSSTGRSKSSFGPRLNDKGEPRWAHQLVIGELPDETPVTLNDKAESVLALASKDMRIFAAADRFTLLSFDYDGSLAWAKRLRAPEGLPEEEMIFTKPISMAELPNGDFGILYARRTVEGTRNDYIVLLRSSPTGVLRFAKRFRFPTGTDSMGVSLVAVDDDLVVAGYGWEAASSVPYVARFDATGALRWAKRLEACGSPRVQLSSAIRRASGDLALVGTYSILAQDRALFTTLSADGDVRNSSALEIDKNNISTVTLAELPTTGFVTLDYFRPFQGHSLQLSTRDSRGIRTGGKGWSLKRSDGTNQADLRPAALRLTTDGGAIVVGHVQHDKEDGADYGLWVSKVPARTFEAPFDATYVNTDPSDFANVECAVTASPAQLAVSDAVLDGLDVADIVKLNPLTPAREPR